MGKDVFGHILVFLKNVSLITKWKVEMLDSLITVRVEYGYLPVLRNQAEPRKVDAFRWETTSDGPIFH